MNSLFVLVITAGIITVASIGAAYANGLITLDGDLQLLNGNLLCTDCIDSTDIDDGTISVDDMGIQTLGGLSCLTGQIPKNSGGVWGCASDDTGSSSGLSCVNQALIKQVVLNFVLSPECESFMLMPIQQVIAQSSTPVVASVTNQIIQQSLPVVGTFDVDTTIVVCNADLTANVIGGDAPIMIQWEIESANSEIINASSSVLSFLLSIISGLIANLISSPELIQISEPNNSMTAVTIAAASGDVDETLVQGTGLVNTEVVFRVTATDIFGSTATDTVTVMCNQ